MEELKKFHDWLVKNCETYLSMVANGSDATGDSWIEGRSDYDILLIFSEDFHSQVEKIRGYLIQSSFTDEYLFVPFLEKYFVMYFGSSHDFSRKFRTKTLFGKDLIPQIHLPTKEQAKELYSKSIEPFLDDYERYLLSTDFWSEKKVRETYWRFFKLALMHMQIRRYGETGSYPRTRDEVVKQYDVPELTQTLAVFKRINDASKEEVIEVAGKLFTYLNKNRT